MRILDCKSPEDQKLIEGAPMMIDYLCEDCRQAFDELQVNLDAMGIDYVVDPGIVRGLDYYTKTAFEFVTDTIDALLNGADILRVHDVKAATETIEIVKRLMQS